jgi:hypothetical protein
MLPGAAACGSGWQAVVCIVQRKEAIRDYLRGFVPNIDRMPLHKVKLLKTLLVPPKVYQEIHDKQATFDQAVGILRRRRRTEP